MVIGGIVAGGIGARMGHYSMPKQFLPIAEKPMVIHVAEKFLACSEVDCVIIGVHCDWMQYMKDLCQRFFPKNKNIFITSGGQDRNQTILRIIEAARENYTLTDDDIIVSHDAVRPFVSLRIINDNIEAARKYTVCDTVVEATDTIVCSQDGQSIFDIPVRSTMYQGQTPQSFQLGAFLNVYHSMSEEELRVVTDACKMFQLKNFTVHLVRGDISNMKITLPFDYKVACLIMENV